MLHTIATGFERKLESSNKKIETLASKSKSLANSLKAEKLKSRSAMKQLLLLTTTQTEELIAAISPTKEEVKEERDMMHTIAIGLERKLESSNKKIETLASKSKSLANSLKAEKLKSRSAMEHLLLLTTTQTEELIATFHTRFTQLKTKHDIAIQKSQRISVNELVSNQKSINMHDS